MLVASPAGFGLRYLFVSLVSLFILMYSIRWIVLDRARVRPLGSLVLVFRTCTSVFVRSRCGGASARSLGSSLFLRTSVYRS